MSDSMWIGDPPAYETITTTDGTTYIGDNVTSGNVIYYPSTTNYPAINIPYTAGNYSGSTITINSGDDKYTVMNLEREDCPISVFVNGRMVTLGVIGTDVECAFVGSQLIFEPGVIRSISYEGRMTVSVEYKDEIHHYNIGKNATINFVVGKTRTIDAVLVSKIQK